MKKEQVQELSEEEEATVINEEKDQSCHPLLNLVEERKRCYTKPTVVRLEYKTRYNPSKKVSFIKIKCIAKYWILLDQR